MKTLLSNEEITITDLNAAIAELNSDFEKGIKAQTLYKTAGMHILLITLDADAEFKRHTAPGPISIELIEGSISFRTDENTYELSGGQLLTLNAKIPHSLYGNERSIFLLTKSMIE